MDIALHSQRRE